MEEKIIELLLPYSNLHTYKEEDGNIYECVGILINSLNKGKDLFEIGVWLERNWLRSVDFGLLKELEQIKQQFKQQ